MNKKAFTLIELLVVVSIIGVLATIVVSQLNRARDKAKDVQLITKGQQLQKAIETFNLFEGRLPTSGDQYFSSYPDYGLAGNCDGIHSIYTNNWSDMINDLGDYLPEGFRDNEGVWPYCFFYLEGTYNYCDAEPDTEYTIIMGLRDSSYPGLDEFVAGGYVRPCLYSL